MTVTREGDASAPEIALDRMTVADIRKFIAEMCQVLGGLADEIGRDDLRNDLQKVADMTRSPRRC